jgi:aspartate 1-decarboxylase
MLTYEMVSEENFDNHQPTVVHVDAENKIVDLSDSVEEMIYSDV